MADRTLHVIADHGLTAFARAAEPFRTERVAELAIVALVYLAHVHPDATASIGDAIVWVVGAVAGRAAIEKGAGAVTRRAPAAVAVAVTTGDAPTDPGVEVGRAR